MSAFLCSNEHINALIRYGVHARVIGQQLKYLHRDRNDELRPEEYGQLLVDQNVRSLAARYGSGEAAKESYPFVYTPNMPLPTVTIIKLCDCYDYQACETGDYDDTKAAELVSAIRRVAIHALPGYDAAPWGL